MKYNSNRLRRDAAVVAESALSTATVESVGRHFCLVGPGNGGAGLQHALDVVPVFGIQDNHPAGAVGIVVGEARLPDQFFFGFNHFAARGGLGRTDLLARFDRGRQLPARRKRADICKWDAAAFAVILHEAKEFARSMLHHIDIRGDITWSGGRHPFTGTDLN